MYKTEHCCTKPPKLWVGVTVIVFVTVGVTLLVGVFVLVTVGVTLLVGVVVGV